MVNRTTASRFVIVPMNAADDDADAPAPAPAGNFDWSGTAKVAANVAIVAGAAYATYKVVTSLDVIAKNTTASSASGDSAN